jgi:flagellar biosynthetic protein FlhB
MADDLGEPTEDATPRRLAEAREEGNVAKSQDLAGALMLLIVTLGLSASVMPMLGQGKALLAEALAGGSPLDSVRPANAWQFVAHLGGNALRVAAPILLIAWAAAFIAHFAQIGWIFSPKAAAPSLSKLNPLAGLSRIFGTRGAVKSGFDLFKVGIVLAVAIPSVLSQARQIVVLPYLEPMQSLSIIGSMIFRLALQILAVLLFLGVSDFLYQRWRHSRDLRMTKQQIKDEMKQSEGDPDVKRRRHRIQQQIAAQRIKSAVPKADVIVTNPEHISIAIQYDQGTMRAPRVIAKGADYLALRIRQIAIQHGIPIVERKPLARALYKDVKINQEIPPEFYKAVAEILAYVYRLSGAKV